MMARRRAATTIRRATLDIDLAADRERALALVPVSRETAARLDRFVDLLLEWQAKTNLIASSTVGEIWTRHVADSLQLLALAPQAKVWVDLGSGAGFPGLVIACALAEEPGATRASGREQSKESRVFARGHSGDRYASRGAHGPNRGIRNFSSRRRGHSTRSCAAEKLAGSGSPLVENWRNGPFSQGSRCRGGIDRSLQILDHRRDSGAE